MLHFLALALRWTIAVALFGVLAAATGLAVARGTMPASSCAVSETAIATLELEKTTGAEVASRLGCDGIHNVELESDELHIETVSWRGDAWPYAVFEAYLINGVLHGTKSTRLSLELSLPPERQR